MKRTKKVLSAVVALLLAMTVVFSLAVPALAEGHPPFIYPMTIKDQKGKTIATYKYDKSARKITCDVTDGAALKNIEIYPFTVSNMYGTSKAMHAMAPDTLDWKMVVLLDTITSDGLVDTYVFNHKEAAGKKTYTETFKIRHNNEGTENVGVDYKKVTADNKVSKTSLNYNLTAPGGSIKSFDFYYSYADGSSKEYHYYPFDTTVHATQTIRSKDGKTTTNQYTFTDCDALGDITKNGKTLNIHYSRDIESESGSVTIRKGGEYLHLPDYNSETGSDVVWTYTKNGNTTLYRCNFAGFEYDD